MSNNNGGLGSPFQGLTKMMTVNRRALLRTLMLVLLAGILLSGTLLLVTTTRAADLPEATEPRLSIRDNILSGPASTVRVPVVLDPAGERVSGLAFPINFDQSCLALDYTDDMSARPSCAG